MGHSLKNETQNLESFPREETGKVFEIIQKNNRIRLADFIHQNAGQIVEEWETFARTLTPAANNLTPLALRDHIQEILSFIVSDIASPQTATEQIQKSRGESAKRLDATAAETHASLRLAGGFDIEQMVSEYRALRASVIKLWGDVKGHMNSVDIIDLTRFNESIDQQLAESVSYYTHKVNYSKDLFIGILSHDLRSPLNAVSMSARLILNMGAISERQTMLSTQIVESCSRIDAIINDLLDVTRSRFGSSLPVSRAPMDMGFVSRLVVDEMRIANPSRTLILDISGDVKGEWDKSRIGQVFSNLIGNALQYGFKDSPIGIAVKGVLDEVIICVHNEGIAIPPQKLETIFAPLSRGIAYESDDPSASNLGLGLYIASDIVVSHGGKMTVTSTDDDGTTFTARFPRAA
jgi:signal transduction histidine kinase